MGLITPLRRAADALFPPACGSCRTLTGTAETLCAACWRDITFLDGGGCDQCGRPMVAAEPGDRCDDCLRHGHRWRRGRAVFTYAGTGRRLVLGLKHGDRLETVPMLAGWLARAGAELLREADLVAPVPLHWTRRLKRRGNQAAVLAQALCGRVGAPHLYAPRLLIRHRATPSQDRRTRADRIANVAGALSLGGDVRGKGVLLVDDVLTTGATLDAAAAVCLDGGARSVDVLVLALVVPDGGDYIQRQPEVRDDEDD